MSERSFRRRIPSIRRRTRPPHPPPSPHRRTLTHRRLKKPSKPVAVLHRCSSEPILWTVSFFVDGDDNRNLESDGVLFRPQTCTDVLATSSFCSSFLSLSPQNQEGYKKDAKVVVNVTVEGSPGPIRTMVQLGSSVEDTIQLVIDEYRKEGRSPQLHKDAAAAFEMHHSHFCLQSLNKSDAIGDVGSRSFYLRKSSSSGRSSNGEQTPEAAPPVQRPVFFSPASLDRRIKKIVRRMRRFWKLLGCLHCE
ncbi:Uncharacterized protein CK203_008967 [Vitis vinifera]|uniref:DUF7054 domain-containing protein n=1 Tax=Vitis vinifera TaxID=29760 RepID=A0A438K2V5_VITVI|nr:Uncharacterized protein CK203_008967 [Vitis vinifera]